MKKINNSKMILVEYHVHDNNKHRVYMMRMPHKQYLKLRNKELAKMNAFYKRERHIKAIKEFIVYISAMFAFTSIMTLLLYVRLT